MSHNRPRRLHARIALLLAVALAACSGPQKKEQPTDPKDVWAIPPDLQEDEERSFWDDFIDEQDGALDVSEFLARDLGFLPLVIPITEPAVGYGLAAALVFFHDKGKLKPGVAPTATPRLGGSPQKR